MVNRVLVTDEKEIVQFSSSSAYYFCMSIRSIAYYKKMGSSLVGLIPISSATDDS